MAIRWRAFAIPKKGNRADEYEDAFAGNEKTGRFAIADGASESSFCSLWAKLLVEEFSTSSPKLVLKNDWLRPVRQRWSSQVDALTLPWYADVKREMGAAAAFLGLVVKASSKTPGGTWSACAVGDCCCFQIRKGRLFRAFPVLHSHDFDNQPQLINSRFNTGPFRKSLLRGMWQLGDQFMLMTDALAYWFLARHETNDKPWSRLARLLKQAGSEESCRQWITRLREQGDLKNDDVTVVLIEV